MDDFAFCYVISTLWGGVFGYIKFDFCDMNLEKTHFTCRDIQILRLIAEGYTSSQIAEELCLSVETIKWYRKRLLAKFQADTSAEMIRLSIENKIL